MDDPDNPRKRTWLDRAIDDAAHHSIELVATDLRTARGYIESALECLERRIAKHGATDYSRETVERIRDVIVKALAQDPFAAPAATSPAASDLGRVLGESIAYACEELKRSPSVPEVRVAVAITANVERVQHSSDSAVTAFREWRDKALLRTGAGDNQVLLLDDIVDRFKADQREHDGTFWADLSYDEIVALLIELFQVRVGRENGQRIVCGLRWRPA